MRMMCPRTPLAALVAAGLFLISGYVLGQTVSGVISGSAVDASGLSVAGASVVLTNQQTGETRSQTVNTDGTFVFAAVLPGTYAVSVQMTGFKRTEKRNLNVTASERLAAGQFVLEVGSVTDSITVSGEGTPVQTTSEDRSAVLTPTQINSLMARGRDFLTLIRVLPGVTPTPILAPSNPDPDAIGRSAFTNIQGLRVTFSTVSMDGISSNDLNSQQAMGAPMNMDAISEVKVLLSNYPAEYGRGAGAVINAVTKSGTRDFHGGGYYYKRHEELNANSFFNNRNNVAKPRYRYNTWGYTIGGPVTIPGKFNRDRNKLFFFFSQEILPTSTPGNLQQLTVPTPAERGGDFSNTLDVNNKLILIKDPNTGGNFASNLVPKDRIDANGQKLLSVFPLPNALDRSVTKGAYNYTFQEVRPALRTNEVFRTDYSATDKLRMYFRGSIYRQRETGNQVTGGAAAWPMLPSVFRVPDDSGVFSGSYTASPTLINEFSVAGHYYKQVADPASDADLKKMQRTALGMTLPQFYPQLNPLDLVPLASFSDVPSAASLTTDRRFPTRVADTVLDFTDNISKNYRAHTLKAGVFLERVRYNGGETGLNNGSFAFGRNTQNPLDSNYGYSNALMGIFSSYQESNTRVGTPGRGTTLEWFLQDHWRVGKRLTLDLGVRFSWFTPLYSHGGKAAGFLASVYDPGKAPRIYYPALNSAGARVAYDPATSTFASAVLIGTFVPGSGDPSNGMVLDDGTKYPLGLISNAGILPAPRLGFAYDLTGNGRTAIRGGFGITYNTRERSRLTFATNPPVQYTPVVYNATFSTLLQGSGVLAPGSSGGEAGNAPSVYNYSFGIQRDVGFNTVVDVAYVGNISRHLLAWRNINTLPYGARFLPQNQDPTSPGKPLPDVYFLPYRGYSGITIEQNGSSANYNSLQVQANRRFAKSLTLGAAYTWSKSMDYNSGDWDTVPTYVNWRVWNYGPSDFDTTQVLIVNWVWDLPKATALVKNNVVGAVFDNWRISGIGSFTTGQPVSVSYNTVDGTDITGGGDGSKVVLVANPFLSASDRTFDHWFNTSAFARPAQGTIGNVQRNVLRKPGTNNFDLSIFKDFPVIKERAKFQFRWEMYNAFNHTQFSGFGTSARFDAAGNQINGTFGQLSSTRQPRFMQGSLRFIF